MRLVVQLLELRVQFHELPRHPVDASVQVPVLAVLPVEVLLVALPLLGAANPRVRPEHGERERTIGSGNQTNCKKLRQRMKRCGVLTVDSPLCRCPLRAPRCQTTFYLALRKKRKKKQHKNFKVPSLFFILDPIIIKG